MYLKNKHNITTCSWLHASSYSRTHTLTSLSEPCTTTKYPHGVTCVHRAHPKKCVQFMFTRPWESSVCLLLHTHCYFLFLRLFSSNATILQLHLKLQQLCPLYLNVMIFKYLSSVCEWEWCLAVDAMIFHDIKTWHLCWKELLVSVFLFLSH